MTDQTQSFLPIRFCLVGGPQIGDLLAMNAVGINIQRDLFGKRTEKNHSATRADGGLGLVGGCLAAKGYKDGVGSASAGEVAHGCDGIVLRGIDQNVGSEFLGYVSFGGIGLAQNYSGAPEPSQSHVELTHGATAEDENVFRKSQIGLMETMNGTSQGLDQRSENGIHPVGPFENLPIADHRKTRQAADPANAVGADTSSSFAELTLTGSTGVTTPTASEKSDNRGLTRSERRICAGADFVDDPNGFVSRNDGVGVVGSGKKAALKSADTAGEQAHADFARSGNRDGFPAQIDLAGPKENGGELIALTCHLGSPNLTEMRFALLQDALFVPALGGANKSNRALLHALVAAGHQAHVVCRAFNRGAHTRSLADLRSALKVRGMEPRNGVEGGCVFNDGDIAVVALPPDVEVQREHARRCLEENAPDWILVMAGDEHLLRVALEYRAECVVVLAHTLLGLSGSAEDFKRARAVVTVSRYARDTLKEYLGVEAGVLRFPVFDPLPQARKESGGAVTLINPCPLKGLEIFLGLARSLPNEKFLAVPTWGRTPDVDAALAAEPNVRVMEPVEDVRRIFAATRVLLAPSTGPETFGLVAVEAMLHGIPVLAADHAGLREAMLGQPGLLPIRPAIRDSRSDGDWHVPAQDLGPWLNALSDLLEDQELYRARAAAARAAASEWTAAAGIEPFLDLFRSLEKESS